MTIVIQGQEHVMRARLFILRGALKLECLGMRSRGNRSAYKVIKQEFGFKGNKESVLKQFEEYIRGQGLNV